MEKEKPGNGQGFKALDLETQVRILSGLLNLLKTIEQVLFMYDIIIVGAGPAGLTSAIFAKRHGLNVLVLDNPVEMSSLGEAPLVENWPGTKSITGIELLENMKEHVKSLGVEIKSEAATGISRNGSFSVDTEGNKYESKALILAMGLRHRKAKVEGAEKFLGKGLSYCTVCDGPMFKGKTVAVIGGGDAAVKGAIALKDMGVEKVFVVHRRDQLRAEEMLQKRLFDSGAEMVWNSVIDGITGRDSVESITVKNTETGEKRKIDVDGVFIEIGSVPVTELLKELDIRLDKNGFIAVNNAMETNVPGVFAAGDISNNQLKQNITACSEGAVAAISAYRYIKS